jgi:uncharacterized protein (TIGR02145 family)
MKRLIQPSLIIIASMILGSCSKKSQNAIVPVHVVNINGSGYPIVVIGSLTWTAANYNGPGGVNYDDSTVNVPANGKLYTQAEANAIILPPGWRLPTLDDFNRLLASTGVSEPLSGSTTQDGATEVIANGSAVYKLMSKTGWTTQLGNNSIGFNALPVGYYSRGYYSAQAFQGQGIDALFVSSSNFNGTPLSFDIEQYPTSNSAGMNNFIVMWNDRGSIRFVKDN